MGVAATFVARLIHRFPVLAWAGLLMILYVAAKMVWEGLHDVVPLLV
jgi:predicted tellurium resistance membrane protein TerC